MIAFSTPCCDTSTLTTTNTSPTSTISETYYSYLEYKEEYKEDNPEWVEPLSHKPLKGTFRQSRGSYVGISKSAKGKTSKLNRRGRKNRY
jgi:uncharacterized protein with von Willebrand factor type A (vWA) domain